MCNRRIKKTVNIVQDQQPQPLQGLHLMDAPSSVANSSAGLNDEAQRIKLLCSFLGSIMPRPQDGKLRYVGGETRIVSLPRDIGYEELMSKMRELYEGASVLKYQQPDEDLDALVSVVNDDDVTNMIEEYEKLGSEDGFTRLRIFLFPHPDQDSSLLYIDGDERDTERRYVDALNNLNDGADFRRQQSESQLTGPFDDIHTQDSFLDGALHSHMGGEMSLPHYNLRHVAIPQRYNEADSPWSPAYYSPSHHGPQDPRTLSEFPNSPPSGRYWMQHGELSDRGIDRMPEELARSQLSHHPIYEHPPSYSENVVWMPTGGLSGDRAGFPGNLLHVPSVFEGNNGCEHCRVALQRNQLHLEQPNMGNGLPPAANQCSECSPNRDAFILNADPKLHQPMYPNSQNDPRSVFNEGLANDRGWVVQPQSSPRADDARSQLPGAGRFNDQYTVDSPAMNYSIGHVNLVDSHPVSSNFAHHRMGIDMGNEVFHDQALSPGHHLHIGPPEECAIRYFPYAHGTENLLPLSHGHGLVHPHAIWRNVHNPMLGASYETSTLTSHMNGTVNTSFLRGAPEVSQRIRSGMDSQHPWAEESQKFIGFDGATPLDYNHDHALKLNPNTENRQTISVDPTRPTLQCEILNSLATLASSGHHADMGTANAGEMTKMETNFSMMGKERSLLENVELLDVPSLPYPKPYVATINDSSSHLQTDASNGMRCVGERNKILKEGEKGSSAVLGDPQLSLNPSSFVPELISSTKKVALEDAEEVKAMPETAADPFPGPKEEIATEPETLIVVEDPDLDSENDKADKIEPTKAEAEAIERGLQTIKNDDLEEIRELGSGTYGAVYHGKWKGSDVAIKRIKASCFAGRPSERERLIADFWKEALILSSLHHPNVVSFYGIVRDGPDGSLATVTEFMINGSLKQFLQKKDRTIDRRKRLIIAMDAAFGMEYLHGKNIVHFDLKCENLLVNMRDPQRPICKIGDLGLSKVKQHTLVSGGVRGTLPWMAPELLSGKSHMVTEKIDVYSFGIVMWELLTGEEPYASMHCASIIGGIVNNTLRPQIPAWCDPEWKSLMESCWSSDPAERPSFAEISLKLRNMAAAINVK